MLATFKFHHTASAVNVGNDMLFKELVATATILRLPLALDKHMPIHSYLMLRHIQDYIQDIACVAGDRCQHIPWMGDAVAAKLELVPWKGSPHTPAGRQATMHADSLSA